MSVLSVGRALPLLDPALAEAWQRLPLTARDPKGTHFLRGWDAMHLVGRFLGRDGRLHRYCIRLRNRDTFKGAIAGPLEPLELIGF
jgi:hypothetical protein